MKKKGSKHYHTRGVEPLDLLRDGSVLWDFCVGNIIKYAFRNRREIGKVSGADMDKIIHYAEILRDLKTGR